MIYSVLKDAFLSLSQARCMQEALIKLDFKIEQPRRHLLQLCFSPLANWPLFFLLGFILLDPFRYSWNLGSLLGENSDLRFLLLDGQASTIFIFVILFFVIEWIFRLEYVLVSVLFYFLAKSELHLYLSVGGLIGIYLSSSTQMIFWAKNLKSKSRKTWILATSILALVVTFSSVFGLVLLNQFSSRIVYFLVLLLLIHFLSLLFLATWGHFYSKIKSDPGFLPIYFSSATWLDRFKLNPRFKNRLKQTVQSQVNIHHASLAQIRDLKDQGLGNRMQSIEEILNKELAYLQMAASRLTIDLAQPQTK